VPKTNDSSPLLFLSGSGKILRFLAVLLTLAAPAAWGQESVLMLAMVRYDQLPARTPTEARCDSAANPSDSVSAPRLQYQVAGLKPDRLSIVAVSFDASVEKQNAGYRQDWLQLVRKKSGGDGWTVFGGHIEAGYGQFCRLESGFGKSVMELEQPSCAYLRARFSF
jgi:hypothetical protein